MIHASQGFVFISVGNDLHCALTQSVAHLGAHTFPIENQMFYIGNADIMWTVPLVNADFFIENRKRQSSNPNLRPILKLSIMKLCLTLACWLYSCG